MGPAEKEINMVLEIKNVGLIESASIELNGITVITGHNNSGKSTVSKSLYCIASSFCDTYDLIRGHRISAIAHRTSHEVAEFLADNREKYKDDITLLSEYLAANQDSFDNKYRRGKEKKDENAKERINDLSKYISNALAISDEELMEGVFARKLDVEFGMQIHNLFGQSQFSELRMNAAGRKVFAHMEQNDVSKLSEAIDITSSVIYIDDVNILDKLDWHPAIRGYYRHFYLERGSHKDDLVHLLNVDSTENPLIDEIFTAKKLGKVYELINKACPGRVVYDKSSMKFVYTEGKLSNKVSLANISTGIKSFTTIKTLLHNGGIKDGGIMIFDEPEIHLHPEWQLVYAQMIVLLHKEFNIRVLINSHSPYFVMAIEDYSEMHEVLDKCKFYLSESDGKSASFRDITDSTKEVYSKFLEPYQELENVRYS